MAGDEEALVKVEMEVEASGVEEMEKVMDEVEASSLGAAGAGRVVAGEARENQSGKNVMVEPRGPEGERGVGEGAGGAEARRGPTVTAL